MRSVNIYETSWKKSSYSAANGNCIEVAHLANRSIGVRDSKNASIPPLSFTATGWQVFVGAVKRGQLDLTGH
ncbi:MAG: DUF397 domain-containing protein [Streptosporangiaceae bacterium]|nr:DUF397 domain-containing protein [Streptosporangiaceae bacterium]MBV9856904.1 DUF397 domain-containing protein [Streptosporangiaceae bacterium]